MKQFSRQFAIGVVISLGVSLGLNAPALAAPSNTIAPTISGSVKVGATLTASNGSWVGSRLKYAYQWSRCASQATAATASTVCTTVISGAASAKYTLVAADAGTFVAVRVTATDSTGSTAAWSASTSMVAQAPANTVAPVILGTATVGAILSGSPGTWTGIPTPTFGFAWFRCASLISAASAKTPAGCSAISGASNSSYLLVSADAGRYLSLRVTASNTAGSTVMFSASTRAITQAPANTVAPVVTGTARVGSVLTGTSGSWAGSPAPTYTYAWFRCASVLATSSATQPASCSAIASATASTYSLVAADVDQFISVRVTATNSQGSAEIWSASTAAIAQAPANTSPPSISGSANVASDLTASTGSWSGSPTPTYAFAWFRCTGPTAVATATQPVECTAIPSAATSVYRLTSEDQGLYIVARVTATNSAGSAVMHSASTVDIGAALQAPTNTVAPSISGTAVFNAQLSASAGTWMGNPLPTYAYQWYRCVNAVLTAVSTLPDGCSAIDQANGATYTVTATDAGSFISVRVSGANTLGTTPMWSATTSLVPLLTQSIEFTQPSDMFMVDSDQALTATATSGLVVAFASTTTGICIVVGSSVRVVSAGTCSVTASQIGNGTYAAAPAVTVTFSVRKVAQTINFNPSATLSTLPSTYALPGTASSGLPLTFTASPSAICNVNGAVLSLVTSGSCSVTASQLGNDVYLAAPSITVVITVNKASQTIAFSQVSELLDIEQAQKLSATASSGLAVTASSMTPTLCSVSSGMLLPLRPGNCIVRFTQIGDATYASTATDMTISVVGSWKQISAGWYHVCAISKLEKLYCWGGNDFGQLGDGTTTSHPLTRVPIAFDEPVVQVSAAGKFTCAVLQSGAAYCWGANLTGQLGDGSRIDSKVPVKILLDTPVRFISAGGWENMGHACAITTARDLYCWGRNADGELGIGTTALMTSPTKVSFFNQTLSSMGLGSLHTCVTGLDSTGYCWGSGSFFNSTVDRLSPRLIGGTDSWTHTKSGYHYTCGVTTLGAVKCWGNNTNDGVLGVGDNLERTYPTQVTGLTSGMSQVAAGHGHACARSTDGLVKCWGGSQSGESGSGSSGSLVNFRNPVSVVQGALVFTDIAMGFAVSFAIDSNGQIYGWGSNATQEIAGNLATIYATPFLVSAS